MSNLEHVRIFASLFSKAIFKFKLKIVSAFYLTVFALQCHYCVHSYKKISDESSIDCLKLERNDTYNQRECTLKETACKATVKLVNGILTEVIRDCSANCNPRCSRKGYGITVLTCDSCCNTSKCNSWSSQEFFSSSSTVRSSLTLCSSSSSRSDLRVGCNFTTSSDG
ncbi:hypothetical protein T09_14522 [Trichinella sp. T9]|nr:hypothetical protein T09_14522 [Trichinella sp. T9]